MAPKEFYSVVISPCGSAVYIFRFFDNNFEFVVSILNLKLLRLLSLLGMNGLINVFVTKHWGNIRENITVLAEQHILVGKYHSNKTLIPEDFLRHR